MRHQKERGPAGLEQVDAVLEQSFGLVETVFLVGERAERSPNLVGAHVPFGAEALHCRGGGFRVTARRSQGARLEFSLREDGFQDDAVELFRIADLTHVWIIAELLGDDQAAIPPGATARVSLSGRPKTELRARVSEALSRFDGASRALELRLDAENPQLILRPDMFVDLEFSISLPEAPTVPAEAIVDSGVGKIVYVERGEGIFEPRRVETGWRLAGRVQIVSGLEPGASIVVSGNVLLDSQSRMRHGDASVHD